MLFSGIPFLFYFLPAVLIVYFAVPKCLKNTVLLLFSLLFYGWGEPRYIIFMLISVVCGYVSGLLLEKWKGRPAAKAVLWGSAAVFLGMLGYFKYADFFIENFSAVTGLSVKLLGLTLPIGISFYTFQILSYTIDVYRGDVPAQRNPIHLAAYIALFPQLIAGPIVRYSTIAEEIENRTVTLRDVSEGFSRFIIGLSKKVILADNLFLIVEDFFGEGGVSHQTVAGTWYAVIMYSLYIYFDFSGYSDMAIGLGRMFGFHFDENFRHPFLCKDITEFWQRWHISLGSFFRDYLLPLPVFGLRNKYLSLAVVWLCTGIWHGASWNYVLWGVYYGAFIVLETCIGKKKMRKIPLWIRHIYNKIVIIIGFGIFYFEDGGELLTFLVNLTPFNKNGFYSFVEGMSACNNIFLIAAAVLFTFPLLDQCRKLADRSSGARVALSLCGTVACAGLLILSSILLVDATTNAFLYYRF